MDTLVHADIFFFVTTIVVIVVGLFFAIALIYLIRIFRHVEAIGKEIKAETVLLRGDMNNLRNTVTKEGFKFSVLAGLFKSIVGIIKRKKTKSKA